MGNICCYNKNTNIIKKDINKDIKKDKKKDFKKTIFFDKYKTSPGPPFIAEHIVEDHLQ